MKKDKTYSLLVRFPAEVKPLIEQSAAINKRSLNNEIVSAVNKHVVRELIKNKNL